MFRKADSMILVAAFISFLFSISLWFGLLGAANKTPESLSGCGPFHHRGR